jgi:hypothetical protein
VKKSLRQARRKSDSLERAARELAGHPLPGKGDRSLQRGMGFACCYRSTRGTPFADDVFRKNGNKIQ